MRSNSLSVLLLAHNEVKSIENDINQIISKICLQFDSYEIIVVEDGSSDGTYEILHALNNKKIINHVHSDKKLGYTQAFLQGVKYAKNEIIFFSDTGGKFDFNDFWKLYQDYSKQNCDLCIGFRKQRADSYLRRVLTFFFNKFSKILFSIKLNDIDSGFRIYRGQAIKEILNNNIIISENLIASEITLRFIFNDKKVNEVEVRYFQRDWESRVIPPNKLLKIILSAIKDKINLKKELKKIN